MRYVDVVDGVVVSQCVDRVACMDVELFLAKE